MKEDHNVKEALLKAGREEFLDKGFERASLRKICEKAGVTTGAVYFFFESKEDLFHQIVAGTVKQLDSLAKELTAEEFEGSSSSFASDQKLMEFLWNNRREVKLLLEKAEGTRYETFKNEIFSQMETNFSLFFQKYGNLKEDKNLTRVLVEMRMRGYMELIYGGYSLEEVLRLSELIGYYADGGFQSLLEKLAKAPQAKQNKKQDM
ncbi:MAG: helix-turn-helix domain-containing protein [Bacillota bacterium]|nr:helix-turn-helix domain-containing protein [Bacillota bacterium]